MSDEDRIPLLHVNRELVASGFAAQAPGYDRLYKGAINGLFPADQMVSNRWSIRRGDLPKVAAAFGLAKASAPARASRVAVEHATA